MSNCTVIVSSCDRYSDLWQPFFNLFKKYWPDCIYPVFLITEEKKADISSVKSLSLGLDKDWSTLMLQSLKEVETPYVLLMLEDFFIRKEVDSEKIISLLKSMEKNNLSMLRLIPRPGPTISIAGESRYGSLSIDDSYRVSTQGSLWKVEVLSALLKAGESAWEFEINGTKRSKEYQNFVSVYRSVLPYYHHVIQGGKWFPWDAWTFSRKNIGVNLSVRKTLNPYETFSWLLGKLYSTVKFWK